MLVYINIDCDNQAMKEVERLRIELNAYKTNKQDTLVVNINNSIDIPKNINVTYRCK